MARLIPAVCVILCLCCSPPPPAMAPTPPAAPRLACRIDPDAWVHANPDSVWVRLERALDAAAPADVVFAVSRDAAAAGVTFDPLEAAVTRVHARGGRIHAAVWLAPRPGEAEGEPPRVRARALVRHLVANYGIDGLLLEGAQGEIVEDAAAEALLVKPWLAVGAQGVATAALGLREGETLHFSDVSAQSLGHARRSQVVGLDLSPWLAGAAQRSVRIDSLDRERTTDAAGHLNLILPALPETLRVSVDEARLALATAFWVSPFRYQVTADGAVQREAPWVELRAAPPDTTRRDTFEVLARTDTAALGWIQGTQLEVYRTGVFFDSVALAPGRNHVRLEARWPDGQRAVYEPEFVFAPPTPRDPFPLWIDAASIEPTADLALLADDVVRISFRGARGQRGVARVRPGRLQVPLSRTDGEDASTYQGDLHLERLRPGRTYRVDLELSSLDAGHRGERLRRDLGATIAVRAAADFPLLVTKARDGHLSYSLGAVRLGGPIIAEYGEGVVLRASGRLGDDWRVRLGPTQVGYIHERGVDELPRGAVIPRYHLTSVRAAPSDSGDVVSIPWPEPVPYAVAADPEGRRLVITLYGVASSSTWVQQLAGLRYVERLAWRQADAETYELTVHLRTADLWGYDLLPEGRSLVLRLASAPALAGDEAQPLRGLKVAVEAGHGGDNTGAVGLSGLFERDVNLATALALGEHLQALGAEVYQLRTAVDGVPYMARRDSVRASGAHVFLSIHANAAGGGFLRAGGTSTYYWDPFSAPLAQRIYERLVALGLGQFGTVGSFNYRPTRMSSRPAVLVEQAFMTHAQDEERLASAEGRQQIAAAIAAGLQDWLRERGALPGEGDR